MFDKKTVFIIGAGASYSYEFPLGRRLIDNIIKGIESVNSSAIISHCNGADDVPPRNDDFGRTPYSALLYYIFQEGRKKEIPEELMDYENHVQFKNRLNDAPVHNSVDAFLADNPSLATIGKTYIALEILCYTAENKPFYGIGIKHRKVPYTRANEEGWYPYFENKLKNGTSDKSQLRQRNNITVITFNYDCSLEYYLNKHLGNSEKFEGANHKDVLEIIHVYGKAELKESDDQVNQSSIFGDNVMRAANNLGIVGDRVKSNDIERAMEKIKNAEKVYIFGFGFDKQNCKLLGLPANIDSQRQSNKVYCINYGKNKGVDKILSEWRIRRGSIANTSICEAFKDGFFE